MKGVWPSWLGIVVCTCSFFRISSTCHPGKSGLSRWALDFAFLVDRCASYWVWILAYSGQQRSIIPDEAVDNYRVALTPEDQFVKGVLGWILCHLGKNVFLILLSIIEIQVDLGIGICAKNSKIYTCINSQSATPACIQSRGQTYQLCLCSLNNNIWRTPYTNMNPMLKNCSWNRLSAT